MKGGCSVKFKFMESMAFVAVLFLLFVGTKILLSNVERTSHLYDYSDTVKLAKQEEAVLDKNTKEDSEEQKDEIERDNTLEKNEESDNTPEENEESDVQPSGTLAPSGEDDSPQSDGQPSGTAVPTRESDDFQSDGQPSGTVAPTGESDGSQSDGQPSGTAAPSGEGDGSQSDGQPSETVAPSRESSQPSPVPTNDGKEPTATIIPDEIVSIACDWPDKNNIEYGKSIPRSSIEVTAQYKSGKTETLSNDQYNIIGLNNKVCGKRQMVVVYEDFECSVSYTVNNYILSIGFEWETKDSCYKGEEIDDDVLYVFANMADGSEEEIEFGDYLLEGIDNENIEDKQNFTISYKGFKTAGTCRFRESKYVTETNYYHDAEYKTLDKKQEDKLQLTAEKQAASQKDENRTLSDKIYVVRKETLMVDGKEKPLTYKMKKRDFDVKMILDCVYDKSQNIEKLEYQWPTKDDCYYKEVIDSEVLTVYAVMEDGTKKILSDNEYKLSEIDNTKLEKEQNFSITYKNYEVSGKCLFKIRKVVSSERSYFDEEKSFRIAGSSSSKTAMDNLECEYESEIGTVVDCFGITTVCTEESIMVDGKQEKLPYKAGKRDFDIRIVRIYIAEAAINKNDK